MFCPNILLNKAALIKSVCKLGVAMTPAQKDRTLLSKLQSNPHPHIHPSPSYRIFHIKCLLKAACVGRRRENGSSANSLAQNKLCKFS